MDCIYTSHIGQYSCHNKSYKYLNNYNNIIMTN